METPTEFMPILEVIDVGGGKAVYRRLRDILPSDFEVVRQPECTEIRTPDEARNGGWPWRLYKSAKLTLSQPAFDHLVDVTFTRTNIDDRPNTDGQPRWKPGCDYVLERFCVDRWTAAPASYGASYSIEISAAKSRSKYDERVAEARAGIDAWLEEKIAASLELHAGSLTKGLLELVDRKNFEMREYVQKWVVDLSISRGWLLEQFGEDDAAKLREHEHHIAVLRRQFDEIAAEMKSHDDIVYNIERRAVEKYLEGTCAEVAAMVDTLRDERQPRRDMFNRHARKSINLFSNEKED